MRVTLLALALLTPVLAAADGLPSAPYIQVNGHGELQVVPDIAHLTLTLEKVDQDATKARADVEGRATKALDAIRKAGVADRDIDAPSVSVYPEYVCDSTTISSSKDCTHTQHVRRSIDLTLRDLSRYGELVDALFKAGVTDLGDVELGRSDRRALEQKARALAVADAHDQAAGLAQSAGVNLGPVYSVAEHGGGLSPRPMMAMAAAKSNASPEYLNGKIEISADVTVFYLIKK
ncbi:MAG TPA: SIMPL domain-containing protein [Gammaproteobacteria bacterium]|jgi:hypothetical protein